MATAPFTWADTHRAPQRAGLKVSHSSADAGWPSLFASLQAGEHYAVSLPAVQHHLLVIPIASRVAISGHIGKLRTHHTLLPGSITLIPGGSDMSTRVIPNGAIHRSMHLYVRQELLETIQEDAFGGGGVALACGFCDQPHMVNVVQRLTGLTPGMIRRSH